MDIQLRYNGYSFVEYEIAGTTLFIDPTFSSYDEGNWDQVQTVRPCDIVAVTAGDFDHYLDSLDVLEDSSAQMVASVEMCRRVARELDLPDSRFVGLDSGEAARTGDFRLLGYKVVPDRFRTMWAEFSRRPFDLPAFMATYYQARPNAPGRAYVIEIGDRRLYHLGSALNSRVDWDDIRELDNHSRDPILVVGCLRENHDEIIRAIRLLDPKTVFLYLAREDFYCRLGLSRDSLDGYIEEIQAAVGPGVELVGLQPGSSATVDMSPVSQKPRSWDLRQQMVALSLLAYAGMVTVKDDPARLGGLIMGFLDECRPVMGQWEFVWGPAIASGPFADRHLVYMVRHRERPHELVVAIRGTNPLALENIVVEVDGFEEQVPWPYAGDMEVAGAPEISKGVAHGIEYLLKMVPEQGLAGAGQTILQYLRGVELELDGQPIELRVTGHSLGGTLATTLALLLQNALHNQTLAKQVSVELSENTKISCVSVAAFTPGNPDFARFSDQNLEGSLRVHNSLDAIPLMYAKQDLQRVPNLYQPELSSRLMQFGVRSTLEKLEKTGVEYEHVMRDQPGLPGTLSDANKTFIGEMLWQHTQGYIELLDLEDYIDVTAILKAQ